MLTHLKTELVHYCSSALMKTFNLSLLSNLFHIHPVYQDEWPKHKIQIPTDQGVVRFLEGWQAGVPPHDRLDTFVPMAFTKSSVYQKTGFSASPCVMYKTTIYRQAVQTAPLSVAKRHPRTKKIAANRLAISCIYALSKEVLSKVDRVGEGFVDDVNEEMRFVDRDFF